MRLVDQLHSHSNQQSEAFTQPFFSPLQNSSYASMSAIIISSSQVCLSTCLGSESTSAPLLPLFFFIFEAVPGRMRVREITVEAAWVTDTRQAAIKYQFPVSVKLTQTWARYYEGKSMKDEDIWVDKSIDSCVTGEKMYAGVPV